MAATLSQIPQEAQRRSWMPPPPQTGVPYPQYEKMPPMPPQSPPTQDIYTGYYMPPPVQSSPIQYAEYPEHQHFSPSSYPPCPQHQTFAQPPVQSIQPTAYYYPPSPKESSRHSSQYSPHDSFTQSSSPGSAEFPPTPPPRPSMTAGTIEPDPLPPHSNPQALTATQSKAFTDSRPIDPVRVGRDEIYSSVTGLAQYTVRREAAHMPSFLSTKPLLTVTRTSDGIAAGHIKFHHLIGSSIELTINGHATKISHSYSLLHHQKWDFMSTSSPNKSETWYWKKDKSTGGAMLEAGKHKHARVLARMKGDLLTFEKGHLSAEGYDEIVCSAVAMAEAARRAGKGEDVADLAASIGDFTAASNGHGGDGGGAS